MGEKNIPDPNEIMGEIYQHQQRIDELKSMLSEIHAPFTGHAWLVIDHLKIPLVQDLKIQPGWTLKQTVSSDFLPTIYRQANYLDKDSRAWLELEVELIGGKCGK